MADELELDDTGDSLSEDDLKHFDESKGKEDEGFDPTEDGRG